jgi:hypothetical protein
MVALFEKSTICVLGLYGLCNLIRRLIVGALDSYLQISLSLLLSEGCYIVMRQKGNKC